MPFASFESLVSSPLECEPEPEPGSSSPAPPGDAKCSPFRFLTAAQYAGGREATGAEMFKLKLNLSSQFIFSQTHVPAVTFAKAEAKTKCLAGIRTAPGSPIRYGNDHLIPSSTSSAFCIASRLRHSMFFRFPACQT